MAIADIERLAHRPVGAAVRRYQKGTESDRGDSTLSLRLMYSIIDLMR